MQITLTVDDAKVDRIVNAFHHCFGPRLNMTMQEKRQYVREHLRNYIRSIVKKAEGEQAARQADLIAQTQAEADFSDIEVT